MAFSQTIDLTRRDGVVITVTVLEMSVEDVRGWAKGIDSGRVVDPVRSLVLDDCSLDDLALMSDQPAEALEKFGHAELCQLRDKCRLINPHFFKVREMLAEISRALRAEADALQSTR